MHKTGENRAIMDKSNEERPRRDETESVPTGTPWCRSAPKVNSKIKPNSDSAKSPRRYVDVEVGATKSGDIKEERI